RETGVQHCSSARVTGAARVRAAERRSGRVLLQCRQRPGVDGCAGHAHASGGAAETAVQYGAEVRARQLEDGRDQRCGAAETGLPAAYIDHCATGPETVERAT